MAKTLRILVVDDESVQREALAELLRDQKYQVVTASSVAQARDQLTEIDFDVVLSDFRMPQESGLEVARFVLERCPETLTMIMTAYADVTSVIESMRLGVLDYLLKPLNVDALLKKLEILQDRRDLKREVSYLRSEVQRTQQKSSRLLGDTLCMKHVHALIEQVANSKSTVLITGESGTGKEVAARQIHILSAQANKKFVAINCGAIPEMLLESELFGHKKGAFTGAVSDKEGQFVAASGGTLFLDEIGEMPKSLQVKILRALQEREVTPVGSTETVKIDVRLIAATNRDLKKDVEAGLFRQDLYYRINVVEIQMPALRDRRDDIPLLTRNIIQRLSKELGKNVDGISNEALRRLMTYPWPGNVRELENVVERAMILSQGQKMIQVSDLPPGFQNLGEEVTESVNLDEVTRAFARVHIVKVLESCGGDKKEAAKALGLSLSSLYRKLEELGIGTKVNEPLS